MAVKSIKTKKPIYWVPPKYTANFRVTVTRHNGTVDDITDILTSLKIEDSVTEGIGNFEFEILNPNEEYTGVWTGMEIFRYYSNYAATSTSLRFRGRIEKPSSRDYTLKVTGRSESLFVLGQDVYKDYSDSPQDAGYILKDLFDTYGESRFDTSSINTSIGTTLDVTFNGIPFWDAVEAVCTASGYDCYVNPALVVQFFAQGSQTNTEEGIVHEHNLVEVGDFAPDLSFVKNEVRVMGGTIDGVQIIYTAKDTASQAQYGIRRENVTDDGIVTFGAAQELANFVLSSKKDPPVTGTVRGMLLASIQPGQNIRISSPLEGIAPDTYRVVKYKHEFDDGVGYTTVTINKEPLKMSHVLKDRIQREHKKSESAANPHDLDFAEIELFNSITGVHSNTDVNNGVLFVQEGQSSGEWTSPNYASPDGSNISKVSVDVTGDKLQGLQIKVSVDGGSSYESVSRGDLLEPSGEGSSVLVKLTLNNSATQIDSVKVLYSTE